MTATAAPKTKKAKIVENFIRATGRRKTACAQVRLYPGTGQMTINEKDIPDYFATTLIGLAKRPFEVTETVDKYDVKATIRGGGTLGQAEALRLGISRALLSINEEFKETLRREGFLTRDQREIERKKPGLKKARKASQFSKR